MKIKKGDTVQVTTGNDAGKTGRVIKVYQDKDRVVVEGINIVKKHARPTQDNPQGGVIQKEAKIDVSNIMLFANGKPSRAGYKFLDNGKKVRYLKSSSEIID